MAAVTDGNGLPKVYLRPIKSVPNRRLSERLQYVKDGKLTRDLYQATGYTGRLFAQRKKELFFQGD